MKFDASNALYDKARRIIPLATQTFSKSYMNFVFGASPLFLDRGDGARVWDVDGQEYIDYILGLLPVVLGYRDADVDQAIRDQLEKGISFSLATALEYEVAERLVRLIPSAEMVRFGKNGSDATTAAVRLARHMTNRDKVVVCGYHGWHDWYIGSTARDGGVPQAIKDMTVSVPYNDPERVEQLLKADPNGFAALIMEPAGTTSPKEGYLQEIRRITEKYGVLLIFDEIVSGFRIHMGGAQAYYGVTPDLSCFGKAMGNGMPISAVVGREEYMRGMEDIFFSGTFGGEALSLAAAGATIDKLERLDVPTQFAQLGGQLSDGLQGVLERHNLAELLSMSGAPWWPRISVAPANEGGPSSVLLTSLVRQELIVNGLLMGMGFNMCLSHCNDEIKQETVERLDRAFATVGEAVASSDPAAHLRGEPIQPIFQVRT